jgi:hypothetical protein
MYKVMEASIRGVQKITGDNLKAVWPKFLHFKLGRFSVMKEVHGANVCPNLKLKIGPKYFPASLSLSMIHFVTKIVFELTNKLISLIDF